MISYIYRLFCKSLLYIHNGWWWCLKHRIVLKTEKCCCVFKDNCFICANKTVWKMIVYRKKNAAIKFLISNLMQISVCLILSNSTNYKKFPIFVRYSKKFQVIPKDFWECFGISLIFEVGISDPNSWEFLGNQSQHYLNLEFLGIPRNSKTK